MKKPNYPSTLRRMPSESAPSRGASSSVRSPGAAEPKDSYREFQASELYCPKCQTAMPVREKQLLYLPTGGVSDYRCARCGTVLGTRRT